MPIEVQVRGAHELATVASAVRRMGADRRIVNDMAKEIRQAIPPIRAAVRASAVAVLPHRGGLGSWVASARVTGTVRRSARNAGVTIRGGRNSAGGRTDLKAIDAGRVRHKTFGHQPWTPQVVRAGFFTDSVTEEGKQQLEDAVITAANRAAQRVLHG